MGFNGDLMGYEWEFLYRMVPPPEICYFFVEKSRLAQLRAGCQQLLGGLPGAWDGDQMGIKWRG